MGGIMAEIAASAAETALENQRIGGLQIRVAAICTLVQICDGFDVNSIGVSVPSLTHAWNLPGPAFTQAFLWSSIGILIGALSAGPIGDRIGRKPLLIGSLTIFGLASLGSAFAGSLLTLTVLRFFTGLGLGGAMANTTALTAEFSPPEKRATAVAIMFCTFSLGAAFGGFIAAWLMPEYGWQSVFLFCGVMAVVILPLLIVALPESLPPQQNAKVSIPAGKLFSNDRARITVLLWIIFFANLLELYILTSWLPTTIHAQGVALNWAQIATALMQLGGIAGALALSPLVDRYGPQFVLSAAFVTAALSIITLGVAGTSVALTLIAAFVLGVGTVGVQNCNNGIAAKFYPTEIRATGVGWALAVGRIGSIFGPAVGGLLLSTGFQIQSIFLVATVPPLVAASAYLAMGRPRALQGDGV
jgi:AAHS family 4-hydroxybenzoate transporter-like MFS transporter